MVVVGCGDVSSPQARPTPSITATTAATTSPAPSLSPLPSSTAPTASPYPSPTRSLPTTRTPTPTPSGLPSALAGRVIQRIPTSQRVAALTFDCGGGAQGVASILATLAREHVTATFFLSGDFIRLHPDLLHAIAAAGHVVGDHSVTYPHMTTLTTSQVRAQVLDAARSITELTGHDPRPWFRFPYGEYDARTLAVVNDLGFAAIGWSVDSKGYLGTSAGTAQDVSDRVVAARSPGMVVLMHVGANPDDKTTFDADALPSVITRLRAAGYGFVTVARLLS
jgi:peptidoglycan/xylan/chitin deacetylase (PgdA/CDA1 family)